MSNHWKEEEFVEYLDNRSAPETRARLEAHLFQCADCRRQIEELRALGSVLDEWAPPPVTAGFEARLRARLAEESAAPRSWLALRPAYAVGLAVVGALVLAVLLWQSPEGERAQVTPAKPAPTSPAPVLASPEAEALVLLDDPLLLSDYELLEEFDILFEPLDRETEKTL